MYPKTPITYFSRIYSRRVEAVDKDGGADSEREPRRTSQNDGRVVRSDSKPNQAEPSLYYSISTCTLRKASRDKAESNPFSSKIQAHFPFQDETSRTQPISINSKSEYLRIAYIDLRGFPSLLGLFDSNVQGLSVV